MISLKNIYNHCQSEYNKKKVFHNYKREMKMKERRVEKGFHLHSIFTLSKIAHKQRKSAKQIFDG